MNKLKYKLKSLINAERPLALRRSSRSGSPSIVISADDRRQVLDRSAMANENTLLLEPATTLPRRKKITGANATKRSKGSLALQLDDAHSSVEEPRRGCRASLVSNVEAR
jgi:hypothetical protein